MVRNFHKIIHYVKDVHCLGNTFRMPVVLEAGTLFFWIGDTQVVVIQSKGDCCTSFFFVVNKTMI